MSARATRSARTLENILNAKWGGPPGPLPTPTSACSQRQVRVDPRGRGASAPQHREYAERGNTLACRLDTLAETSGKVSSPVSSEHAAHSCRPRRPSVASPVRANTCQPARSLEGFRLDRPPSVSRANHRQRSETQNPVCRLSHSLPRRAYFGRRIGRTGLQARWPGTIEANGRETSARSGADHLLRLLPLGPLSQRPPGFPTAARNGIHACEASGYPHQLVDGLDLERLPGRAREQLKLKRGRVERIQALAQAPAPVRAWEQQADQLW